MAINIGPRIGVDGEAEYRKQLKEIITETKTLDSEMKKLESTFDKDTSVKEKNEKKTELLTKQQELLKQRVEECRKGVEQATAKYGENAETTQKWKQALNNAETELNQVNAQLKDTTGIQAWKAEIDELSGKLNSIGSGLQSAGRNMSMYVTAPIVALGTKGAMSFAEVDKTMQLVESTMGEAKWSTADLGDAMAKAAANSVYGMSDAATASLNFARAGLDAAQAADALAPAMNLAAGEGGNLDTVSAGLVATINGFHGAFSDTAHYADVFANACNNSALDVDSLSEAMAIAAPIFASAGYSVEDAALMIGVMANNGIAANEAATALKTGLAKLVAPTDEAAGMLEKLGISVANDDGSMRDMIAIQKDLNTSFSTLSESEQLAAASAIFGKNHMAKWLALINTAPKDVGELSDTLTANGTTTEMATAMMSGFGGSLEKLKSTMDVAATSLGETLAPMILAVTDKVQGAVEWFNNLDDSQKETIVTIGLMVAAIGPVLLIIGTLISTIGSIVSAVGVVGTALSGVALGPIALVVAAIAGLVAAGIALWQNWDTVKAKASSIFEGIKNTIKNAIEKIKSLFNFKWEFPKPKLPHFSWSWMDIGGIISIPKISIDWYAKAMQNGMILDSPTIFGASGGHLLGAGEAGSETVVGTGSLMGMIRQTVRETMGLAGDTNNYGGVTVNVYGAPGQDVDELANIIEQRITSNVQRRGNAW